MSERTVRHREDAPPRYRGFGVHTSRGESVTVGDDVADLLLGTGYYDEADEAESDDGNNDDSDTNADDSEMDTEADTERDPNDGEEFDEGAWFELGYNEREARVLDGEVDDQLEEIHAAETSKTVARAVEQRQDDLGDSSGLDIDLGSGGEE